MSNVTKYLLRNSAGEYYDITGNFSKRNDWAVLYKDKSTLTKKIERRRARAIANNTIAPVWDIVEITIEIP